MFFFKWLCFCWTSGPLEWPRQEYQKNRKHFFERCQRFFQGWVNNTGLSPSKSVNFFVWKCDPDNYLQLEHNNWINFLDGKDSMKEKAKSPKIETKKCDSWNPVRLFSENTLILFDKLAIHHQHPRPLHHRQHRGFELEPIFTAIMITITLSMITIPASMILMIR